MTSEQDNLPTCVRIESMNLVKKNWGYLSTFKFNLEISDFCPNIILLNDSNKILGELCSHR